ncbi:glycosyltransferase family 4 protein [Halobacillus sp. H74]|uniref:glycosyltransferase family 4 protein n=1 Tax=Halobacillus sp. H74 TaxID=3457436 RepID=UPI003FCD91FE
MKILYVSTLSNTINAFMIPHIELLLQQGHKVDIVCNVVNEINPKIIKRGVRVFNLNIRRSPLSKSNFDSYKKLKRIIRREKYDIVHTHTPVASVLARLSCKKLNNVKVIYTAHGFHFHKGAPFKNWLVYFPLEYYLSKHTDEIITVNEEDFNRAKKFFNAAHVSYIPGVGLNTNEFSNVRVNKEDKFNEIGLEVNNIVLLTVAELNKNKNQETAIRAVAKLNNPNIQYLICGEGPSKDHLVDLTKNLGIENQVKFLGYRNDVAQLCKAADIFVFPSRREGLGMAALEAMATGLPLITSNVHGIVDYSINNKSGYSFSPADVNGFASGIKKLVEEPELRIRMGAQNVESVKKFDLSNVIKCLDSIYK